MSAKIFEFTVLSLVLISFLLAAAVGVQVSLWLGLLLLLFLILGLISIIYNFDYLMVRRLLDADDRFMLHLCESGFVGRARSVARRLPSDPRCRFCMIPFNGVGKLLGIRPYGKNPNYCRSCFEALPTRTYEIETGVLFADIRGYTSWTETHSSNDAVNALTRFYDIANRVLTTDDALVEFVGDQIMALYPTSMPSLSERPAEIMLAAANRLVSTMRSEDDTLPVGVGLNLGLCRVGPVAKGDDKDFTAIGDVVNTAARLQGKAEQYEIVLSETVYDQVQEQVPEAKPISLELKGKERPLRAYVIAPG